MLEADKSEVIATRLYRDTLYHNPQLMFDMIRGSSVLTSGVFYGSLYLFIYHCRSHRASPTVVNRCFGVLPS